MDERQELERFCADAYPRLVGALAHHVGDRWLAEEFAQEALLRACTRWPQVSGLESPVGWAFRVGVNLARSHFRSAQAERRARQRRGHDPVVITDEDSAARLALWEALQRLTSRQREAVVLRYFLGLNADEAARVLGKSPGAVRALTHRAVATLRALLDVEDASEEITDAS